MRIFLFCLTLLLISSGAHAAPQQLTIQCFPREVLENRLAEKAKEAPIAAGLARDGKLLVVIYANANGEDWTIVGTSTDGVSCLIMFGKGWHQREFIEPEAGTGS